MYSIEELVVTFEEHHKKSVEHNKKILKEFQENYPDEPIPEWFTDEFSLPLALKSICMEILKLKVCA